MSIQRWTFINGAEPHWLEEHPMGEYVTYADHVAAVAAAQREGANQGYLNGVATNADNSFKAGVKAAREAVAAHIRADLTGQEMFCGRKRGILAAIDGVTTRGEGGA